MPEPHFVLEVDRTDATHSRLASFAGRIKALLDEPKVQADAYLRHALDDFLGAIYALFFARHFHFADRPMGTQPEPDKVQLRAEQVANGRLRIDGQWMAGFHFNSALLRIAAVYHRVLRVLANDHRRNVWVDELQNKLLTDARYAAWPGRPWSFANLQVIHTEVNRLKHDGAGVGLGRDARYAQALDAIEELLILLEACPDIH